VYYAMGKKDKAIEELKQLTQEYPTDERYWAFLGNLYLSVGENKQAKAMIDKAMELEPRMPAAELMLLHYYENTNQSSRKDSMRMAVIGNEGVTSDDKVNLLREAIVLSEQTDKDSTKVVSLFQQSVELNKKDANMLMLYIQYLLSKKMNEQSIPVVQQLIAVDPENMPARLQLLSNALTQKDYKTVVGVCQDALLYLPGKFQFYYYQGVGYYLLKEYDQALAILEKATKVEFGKDTSSDALADLYSLLGDLYHEKELFNKMCTAYDTALKYDPDKIMTLNNYAYYLSLQRKNLDKAEEMSYKTIQAEPKNNTYLDTYAWILFEKKRWAEAKVYIDQAMTNGGDKEGSIVEHCGDIYFMNNLKKEALDYWEKALQLGGGSSQLKQKVNKKTYIFP
ncbi:MAG: tetratricopeptide repeat protein, partial [Bacteroidaceae bacterium]|nr:tetratricopeptide repeat protein [Bacteroidaceae bacterium]